MTDHDLIGIGPEGFSIAECIDGFQEICFSLPVFANKKYLPSVDRYFVVFNIPEIVEPDSFKGHGSVLVPNSVQLHGHDNMEIILGGNRKNTDRLGRLGELHGNF